MIDPINFPNGRPTLLDANGRPFPHDPVTGKIVYNDGRPEASGLAIPHTATFVARVGSPWNTYLHDRFDEALRHARTDAEAMRNDAYLMALVDERKFAVLGTPWHVEVPDDGEPYQRRVRDGLTQILRSMPLLRRIQSWLLEALWYGRSAVQVRWKWGTFVDRPAGAPSGPGAARVPGVPRRCLTVDTALPFNGDKVGFQFDGTPYVLAASHDADEVPGAPVIQTTLARAIALRGPLRERFLLHRHLMEDADFFRPEQASAVHGVGIRSKIFWLNWLKLEWLANITDFFDRVGLGFMMWRYPAGNEQARREAEAAARNQSSSAHLLVPVWGEAGREALTGVERVEVPSSGSEALAKMIDYIDRQIERYIVGQSGSARSQPAGIGNEAATQFQMQTKLAIAANDAHNLGVSMTGDDRDPGLLSLIKKYTFPDADFPAWLTYGVERPEGEKKLQAGKTLVDMGVPIAQDEFRAAGGYDKPAGGDAVVTPPEQAGMAAGAGGMDPAAGGAQPGPTGGFLDALRMGREGPLRYGEDDWKDTGVMAISPTGKALHRWYSPSRRQTRLQHIRPGANVRGGRKGRGRLGGPGALDLGSRARRRIARALAVMFPGGWVRVAGLPALAGLDPGGAATADVYRGPDASLVVAVRAPDGPCELALSPAGRLTMTLPTASRLEASLPALAAAGVDLARAGGQEKDPAAGADLPAEVAQANAARRAFRERNAEELMAEADLIVQAAAAPEAAPEGAPGEAPSRFAAARQAAEHLAAGGMAELAREVAIAFAGGLGRG